MEMRIRKEFEKVALVPSYYGFLPIETPSINKEDEKKAAAFDKTSPKEKWPTGSTWESSLKEKIAILRMYSEYELHKVPQPILLYFKKPFQGTRKKSDPAYQQFDLEVLGSARPIVDALAIQATLATLSEEGFKNMYVTINSVGDRESISRFSREIEEYYRKHIEKITAKERELFKQSPLALFVARKNENDPKPITFLSEPSRKHFMETLEFLETLCIPYSIDPTLIGDTEYCSHTIFSVRAQKGQEPDEKNDELLAVGARYNQLSRKIGFRKEVPAIGVECLYKRPRGSKGHTKITAKNIPEPKFYFIQLGTEAKLKSLGVIEALRKKNIPICHSITRDKCAGQLSLAEKMNTPYVIIIGQKEAMENTALLREMNSRSQKNIPLCELPAYLKKLRLY